MTADSIKVLLVDDTVENLIALGALLRKDGIELLQARSGAEALELLLLHEVSLALLDVQMPEMDGFELAELMRGAERTKHVPIIFVTAGSRDPSRVFKGYETGAVDFLFKPVDPHILASKVDVFIQLAQQRQELAQALRLNEMFVAIVGHDLRNPLAAIVAGTELLAMGSGDDRQQRVVKRMASASARMTEMIEQLLDLTRARLGGGVGFARNKTVVDACALVDRAVDELRTSHPEREITISIAGDCMTHADGERLLQLFSNLVGNALAHGTPKTAVEVTIAGRERDLLVEVKNQGVIPADFVASMFEPFRSKAKKPVAASAGLGLGMYISQQIARAHGGEITVASAEGVTSITVVLPRPDLSVAA